MSCLREKKRSETVERNSVVEKVLELLVVLLVESGCVVSPKLV